MNLYLYRSVITLLYARHSKIELNGTQSNSIRGLSTIEFGNRTKSNTRLSVSSISEQIEFIAQIELNRAQFNGLSSIGSGKPIQSKPKASPSKQVLQFIQQQKPHL